MTVDPGSASMVRDLPVLSMKVILTMRPKRLDSGPIRKSPQPDRQGACLYTPRHAARQSVRSYSVS
jgi:hypothetical protein